MRNFTISSTREDYEDLIVEMNKHEWKGHTVFSTKPDPMLPKDKICVTWKSTEDEDFFKIFNLFCEVIQR